MVALLPFISLISTAIGASIPQRRANSFPPTHPSDLQTHDPTILKVGDTYYSYGVAEHMIVHEAPSLSGPWKPTGNVLDADAKINKNDPAVDITSPWAPMAVQVGDTIYLYYSVSSAGCRDSAIGVATSKTPGPGGWTDHGVVINTGTGQDANEPPFQNSNAIDPSALIMSDGSGYLVYGSYWSGIWEVPLGEDLISLGDVSEGRQLAWEPKPLFPGGNSPNSLCKDPSGSHPIEGSFLSYHAGWYYLWYSHGQCCNFDPNNLPAAGLEYEVRVGRSADPRGPFTDKSGTALIKGGGETVYGSNAETYAPGGQGVMVDGDTDILYYHYINQTVGYDFSQTMMGYSPLTYVDGWPVAQ